MRVAVVMGTRPEAIKMAPVIWELQEHAQLEPWVIHTGQHLELIDQVVDLFDLRVDRHLEVMRPGQTLGAVTARLIERFDAVLAEDRPDVVLVQGDTASVLACALASFYRHVPVGYVESGLRTGDLSAPFPEEANRRLTTPIVNLHFAPTKKACENLLAENVASENIFVTGNTVIDTLAFEVRRQESQKASIDERLKEFIGDEIHRRPFVLVTGHRRENFGSGFDQICSALKALAHEFADHLFIYPVHLNPNVKEVVHQQLDDTPNVRLIEPQPYREFVALLSRCRLVLTDSGGVQEEAPTLGKPVLVMRETTERPEGVEAGAVKLVGANADRIINEVSCLLTDDQAYRRMAEVINPYGDGKAAHRIVEAISRRFPGGREC